MCTHCKHGNHRSNLIPNKRFIHILSIINVALAMRTALTLSIIVKYDKKCELS